MLWDAVQLRNRQECRMDFHHVPDPNTASAFNFRTSSRLSSGQVVSALQRVVTCRYRTRDRQVFVWQSYMDGEGMFTGLRAGETGWDILTRSVDASGLEKVTRTTVIWHTPMHVGNATIPESIMKEFTAMTIDSVSASHFTSVTVSSTARPQLLRIFQNDNSLTSVVSIASLADITASNNYCNAAMQWYRIVLTTCYSDPAQSASMRFLSRAYQWFLIAFSHLPDNF